MLVLGSFSIPMSAWVGDQGLTGRGFLLRDGTGRVLAKKFGYRDGSGRVVRKFERHIYVYIEALSFSKNTITFL